MISCRFRQFSAFALTPCRPYTAWLAGVLCLAMTTHAAGTEIIGRVKVTRGDVFIISEGVSTRAEPGNSVKAADTLVTGSSGSIGVTLRDGTRISLGPTSAMLMKEFEFEPLQGKHSFVGAGNAQRNYRYSRYTLFDSGGR
jgi:hypothetical protein